MLTEMALAAMLMLVTTIIHAGGMLLSTRIVRLHTGRAHGPLRVIHGVYVGIVILLMFLVAVAEVIIWAFAYLGLDAFDNAYEAVYFSMVTFTTLGYGDIVPRGDWRLLASFQAANGIIMFGWTTAIVLNTVQRIYYRDKRSSHT